MNKKIIYTTALTALTWMSAASADWLTVADFDSYQPGWGKAELDAAGWNYVEIDFSGFLQCTDGTWDCTAMRDVVSAPYSPAIGSSNALQVRAGNPASAGVANSWTSTSILLPQEIPVNEIATFYIQFALEDTAGERMIALTDIIWESPETVLGYGEGGALMQFSKEYRWNIRQSGYPPAIVDPSNPDANVLQSNTWYELWLLVDNQDPATGDELGARYDVYIRGGQFGTGKPFHATNTGEAYIANGYTEWFFRRNLGNPVRTFNLIAQYGNPDVETNGFGAMYINSMHLFPGKHVLTCPDCIEAETWNGYTVDSNGWANTGDWMGYVYVDHSPWLYQESIGWIYYGSGDSTSAGGWIYALKD